MDRLTAKIVQAVQSANVPVKSLPDKEERPSSPASRTRPASPEKQRKQPEQHHNHQSLPSNQHLPVPPSSSSVRRGGPGRGTRVGDVAPLRVAVGELRPLPLVLPPTWWIAAFRMTIPDTPRPSLGGGGGGHPPVPAAGAVGASVEAGVSVDAVANLAAIDGERGPEQPTSVATPCGDTARLAL